MRTPTKRTPTYGKGSEGVSETVEPRKLLAKRAHVLGPCSDSNLGPFFWESL